MKIPEMPKNRNESYGSPITFKIFKVVYFLLMCVIVFVVIEKIKEL